MKLQDQEDDSFQAHLIKLQTNPKTSWWGGPSNDFIFFLLDFWSSFLLLFLTPEIQMVNIVFCREARLQVSIT